MNLGGEKKDVWGARTRESVQRWVDNQSTESSFHRRKFKADGVRACCLSEGPEREGERKDFDFIWQPETPSHSLYQKRARSVERALPQNQYRHKEQGDRDKESDRCGERKFKIQVERKRG